MFHVENISLNQLVWWFIIHQGQNHKCDYCGKFYTQMTNLKIHLWLLCPWWIILIWIIRLMKNLYTHFQIACFSKFFATLITIKSFLSWTAIILCPYNPILCVKFLPHSSHLYFLKPFIDIYHGHFKIFLSNNFFCTNFTLEFCKFSKCQWCSYAWGLVLIFSILWTFC